MVPNPMKTFTKVQTCIFLAAAVWLCLAGCKPKSHVTPPPPLVEVVTVTKADVPIYHDWIGVLDGLVNAQIRAQVTGYLLVQNYREGDPIKKGDLLFEIDPRPFKAALDQANGLLAQAEARFGKTELVGKPELQVQVPMIDGTQLEVQMQCCKIARRGGKSGHAVQLERCRRHGCLV